MLIPMAESMGRLFSRMLTKFRNIEPFAMVVADALREHHN
jgi:hypothetical protein